MKKWVKGNDGLDTMGHFIKFLHISLDNWSCSV